MKPWSPAPSATRPQSRPSHGGAASIPRRRSRARPDHPARLHQRTVGFSALSKQTQIPEKSLMRMVGPRGNPTASNLFAIMAALQHANTTRASRAKAGRVARLDTPSRNLLPSARSNPAQRKSANCPGRNSMPLRTGLQRKKPRRKARNASETTRLRNCLGPPPRAS